MTLTLLAILSAIFGIAINASKQNFEATFWAIIALIWMIVVLMKDLTE